MQKLSNHFNKAATMIAHSRDLHLLRTTIGPIYDLVALWELHTQYEFHERDVDATMKTMVAQPYVNHIPTMTGGVGFENLRKFYSNFFINSNPPDTKLIPVSRTIGIDRLVDEMIFSFTHTTEVPWMLPRCKAYRENLLKSHLLQLSILEGTSSTTNTSIGIKHRCWYKLACFKLMGCL